MIPALNDPFNEFYDTYSVRADKVTIPSHFDQYNPDNEEDYSCVKVICPNPRYGAKNWTMGDKWITIGIYRDEGRLPAQRPPRTNLTWSKSGKKITITAPKHDLVVGETVSLYNMNVPITPNVKVLSVLDSDRFVVEGVVIGANSGSNGSYQEDKITDFYTNYRVFRLLPSFKLIPYSQVLQIFQDTAPLSYSTDRLMYDISKSEMKPVPSGKSRSVNYSLPVTVSMDKSQLSSRFRQVYDSSGNPLPIDYQNTGMPIEIWNVDSKFKNAKIFYNQPREVSATKKNSRIFVYDFYGLELNDVTRGPYFTKDLITPADGIDQYRELKVKTLPDGTFSYHSTLNDEYGNLAIGVDVETNTLIVRLQILPLELDRFNKPIKDPINGQRV